MPSLPPEIATRLEVAPSELGTSLCALRLCVPEAQKRMQLSLSKLGQLTPVQAFRTASELELFDGIKRLRAAQELSWPMIRAELHALETAGAKVRLLQCNQDEVAQVVVRRGLTARQTSCLVETLLSTPPEGWPELLEQVTPPAPEKKKGLCAARRASSSSPMRGR
jgi:hypothetical protein